MRPTVQEIPNPAYQKWQKERRMFVPLQGSVPVTGMGVQPSLNEQEKEGYRRYDTDALLRIRDICDHCPDCSDCSFAKEMQALDRCVRVQRVLGVKR